MCPSPAPPCTASCLVGVKWNKNSKKKVEVHRAAMTSTLGSHEPPTPAPEIKAQLLREEALEALAKAHVRTIPQTVPDRELRVFSGDLYQILSL